MFALPLARDLSDLASADAAIPLACNHGYKLMVVYHVTVDTTAPPRWLLLLYKIPREPTVGRVSVWRKLKRLGAILLHDAVWVLPPSPRTKEEFQWLVAEIQE